MDRHRIAVVIPAINEAPTITAVVLRASQYGVPVVVDDGSTDGTADRALQAGAQVVRHEANLGYDAALNSGFAYAAGMGCDYVLTVDADGQHNPATLASFIQALDEGAELVIGVRDRRQRWSETLFAWVTKLRWGIRDPLCGMKGYRIGVWQALGHFDSYRSIGTELAIHAAVNGRRVAQVPVATGQREEGRPRFGRRLGANLRITRALLLSFRLTSSR